MSTLWRLRLEVVGDGLTCRSSIRPTQANYNGSAAPYEGGGSTVPVDSFEPNPWGNRGETGVGPGSLQCARQHLGMGRGLLERQQFRQPWRPPRANGGRLHQPGGARRFLEQRASVPALRQPLLDLLRRPGRLLRLPVGQNVISLNYAAARLPTRRRVSSEPAAIPARARRRTYNGGRPLIAAVSVACRPSC
jgi:hypothetical protein